MKILDLSLSQHLANNKASNTLKENSKFASVDDLTADENLNEESSAPGIRSMFGAKSDKSETPEKERDLKNCHGYIIKILGLKDYSIKELYNKATKLGYKIEDIQTILNQLITDNWINDERLAVNLIECYNGRKGKAWLQQKLSMRLINKEIITKVLSEIDITPSESLKKQIVLITATNR